LFLEIFYKYINQKAYKIKVRRIFFAELGVRANEEDAYTDSTQATSE
jgi:hypothetical protein